MPLHHSSGRWQLGLGLSLFTVSLWGVLPIALKVVLEVVDVYTVTWFRFLMSFGLLGLFLISKRQLPSVIQLRHSRLPLLAIATAFLALNYLFFLQGLHHTSPTNSQVIIQLAPVFFGLGALAVFREHYSLRQWLGMSVLIAGMSLFFEDQLRSLVGASQPYLLGTASLVLAAITWAVYALAQKQLLSQLPSSIIMWIIYGGSALLFTPVASPAQLLQLTGLQWLMLLFSGLNTVLAYGAFAEALEHWEASRVSAVLSLTPIVTLISVVSVGTLFPDLIKPEIITITGLVGSALVVLGSFTIALGKNRNHNRLMTIAPEES
jgi:drug/metabolite transporter (DMT)-like permease